MTTILEFITARLEEDEQIAHAALGECGRKNGATVQRWRWEHGETDAVLTDGSAPISAEHCWPPDIGGDRVEGEAALRTVEVYPTRIAGRGLSDGILPAVEEAHAGAARHIAANDPAATLRRCAVFRAMLDWANGRWGPLEDEMRRDIAAYWSTHEGYLPEWAPTEEGERR